MVAGKSFHDEYTYQIIMYTLRIYFMSIIPHKAWKKNQEKKKSNTETGKWISTSREE